MHTRALLGPLLSLIVIALAACSPDSDSVGPETVMTLSDAIQLSDSSHYYLYFGEPMYLVPEAGRFVVNIEDEAILDVVRDIVSASGSSVTEERSLFQVSNHSILNISGSTDPGVDLIGMLRSDPRIAFVAPMYRLADDGQEIVMINQFDVQFHDGTPNDVIDEAFRSMDATVIRPPMPDSGFVAYRLRYPTGADPLLLTRELQRSNASVEWVSADMISAFRPFQYFGADPYYRHQFYLKNSNTMGGVHVDINIEPAWGLTTGSTNVRVAVIDDGIDALHGNTGGDMSTGQWMGGHGYDPFWPNVPPGEGVFVPCCNDTHGTSIAGIIWASHSNWVGIAGIAPNTRLAAARIFRRTYPPESVTSPFTQVVSNNLIADAINWVASPVVNSAVINNSWGGGAPTPSITSAINNVVNNGRGGLGTVVVFAAGNTSNRDIGVIGSVLYPATLAATTNVISVGAIDRFGNPANYTPNGAITVVAPSGRYTEACVGEVVTMDRRGSPGCNDGPAGNIDFTSTFSGTSAAAPQVAGVAALILSRHPGLTAGQVKARIQTSADSWGPAITFGSGKLNAFQAVF